MRLIQRCSYALILTEYRNYYKVDTGDKVGLVDLYGTIVVPAEYDDVKTSYHLPYDAVKDNTTGFVADDYICVIQDDKVGFVKNGGEVTYAPQYAKSVIKDFNGVTVTYVDLEGKTHLIAADGVDTALDTYDHFYPLDNCSGYFYRADSANSYGIVDWHGNVVLDLQYSSLKSAGNGKYVLVQTSYNSPYSLYELNYPGSDEAEPETNGTVTVPEGNAVPETEAVETEGNETVVDESKPAQELDKAAVSGLLTSVITLLKTDAATNKDTSLILLNNALEALGADEAISSLVNSTVSLLNADAAGNAGTVVTILETAISMLQ